MKQHFRPEFINRLDEIVIFDILTKEAIKEIVEIEINKVRERLQEKSIKLELTPDVYEYLAKEGYTPQYGARPLKRLIQNKMLTPVASLIIDAGLSANGTVVIGVKKGDKPGDATEFTFEVKKGKKAGMTRESVMSGRARV